MIRAYFDRNVWQDLYDQTAGIAASDVERLRSAVRHREVDVVVSAVDLEETYARWTSEPLRGIAEMRFILEIAGMRNHRRTRLVKEPGEHIDDEIRAYATGLSKPSPYVVLDMSPLLSLRTSDYRLVEQFARETRQQKGAFYDFSDRQRHDLARKSGSDSLRIRLAPDARRSFEEYFEMNALEFAKNLAEKARVLPQAEERGLGPLLNLRSVRLAVGSNLSLVYSQIFENRAPQQGDSRDMHHAIAAAAADVFVTNDARFAQCLRRIPEVPVEVIDLKILLSRLGRTA